MEEIASGAAMLADPGDPSSIAAGMMQLYKDEKGRKELIMKGVDRARIFDWDKSASLFWESILRAATNT
jgi:hypothetical protein